MCLILPAMLFSMQCTRVLRIREQTLGMVSSYYGLNYHTVKNALMIASFSQINCSLANAHGKKLIVKLIYIKTLYACRLWNFIKVSILVQPL